MTKLSLYAPCGCIDLVDLLFRRSERFFSFYGAQATVRKMALNEFTSLNQGNLALTERVDSSGKNFNYLNNKEFNVAMFDGSLSFELIHL